LTARPVLVLASASPRRRQLLASLGLHPEIRPAHIDESARDGERPVEYVARVAREKAEAVAAPGELVLAADTTVRLGERLLGKPANPAEARSMLAAIAGREHEVLTGVALLEAGGKPATVVESTRVRMAPMSEEEIRWYAETGEPLDKAGSYAIQDLGSLFVDAIDGNYTNVVGLPLPAVYRLFDDLGYDLREFAAGRRN
jgi:septum formation protein